MPKTMSESDLLRYLRTSLLRDDEIDRLREINAKLLEACRVALHELAEGGYRAGPVPDQLRIAIAKATTPSPPSPEPGPGPA